MKLAVKISEWKAWCYTWLTQHAMPYYRSLLPREQYLLLFAVLVLPVLLFVFGVFLPLMDARDIKQTGLLALHKQVVEAESLAQKLNKQGHHIHNDNTMTVVDQEARHTGVRSFIVRMRPQPAQDHKQRLLIHIRDAPYDKTVVFLHALSKQGLSLLQVKFQQAKRPAYIHAQVTVE